MSHRLIYPVLGGKRSPEVPVRRRVVGVEVERPGKFDDGLVQPAFYRVRDAQDVMRLRRLGDDRPEIRAAGNDSSLLLPKTSGARRLRRRRAVRQGNQRDVRIQFPDGRGGSAVDEAP